MPETLRFVANSLKHPTVHARNCQSSPGFADRIVPTDLKCLSWRRKIMRYVTGTLAVLLLVAIIVFSIQNRASADVSFLAWSVSMPKAFLIMGTYFLGMLTGWGLVLLMKKAF
jgi:uncharacterized integral membrane protein